MTTAVLAAKPQAATPAKPVAAAKSVTSAKAPAAAKPAKVELITLRQLAAAIGEAHGLSQTQANGVLLRTNAEMPAKGKSGP